MPLVGLCEPTGLPAWSRDASIGDYGGASDKIASEAEGVTPYAYAVYRELQAQRGSAYSTATSGTLVHVENLAQARTLSAVWFRLPEKARANATPLKSDERLEYWATVLGVPARPSEDRWQLRLRCAAHYETAKGPTYDTVRAACANLLGDAFVELHQTTGASLSAPPSQTYWPGVNPGDSANDLGGGAWTSKRCHYVVEVVQPAGMGDDEFINLMQVQLFQLLDPILPIYATFSWAVIGDGFRLGISRLGIQAFGS